MHYHSFELIQELQEQARNIRLDVLDMVYRRQAGHPEGCFSAAEILACLYFHQLNIDPKRPRWPGRDRFILSKDDAAAAVYSALARRGFFALSELEQWGHAKAQMKGHPEPVKTPGVDMSSAFLGHGLSIGAGMALAQRLSDLRYHIYVLVGDGDMQAGAAWDGAMIAAKYHTIEMTVIMDFNDAQLDGTSHDIMPLEPLADKWRSYGFRVIEINGHAVPRILGALDEAVEVRNKPVVILAHTTKGKGVSFMENSASWHGGVPNEEQYQAARGELRGET